MWEIDKRNPCKNGVFVPDGGEEFIDHIPAISGNCICDPGYWGPLCEFKVFVTRGGLKSQNVSQRIEYSKGISIRSTNKKRMAKTLYYNPIFYMNFGPDPKKKAKFLEKVKGGHLLNIVPTSSGREVLSYFEGDELIAYQLTDKIYIFQDTCRFYIEKAGIVYDVFPEGIKPRYRINKGECQGFLTKEEFLTQVFTKKCHVFVK